MREMVVEEIHCNGLKRARRRRDLNEDVDAVLVFVDHALEATNLTLNSLQSFLKCGLLVDVRGLGHGTSLLVLPSYPMGVYYQTRHPCCGARHRRKLVSGVVHLDPAYLGHRRPTEKFLDCATATALVRHNAPNHCLLYVVKSVSTIMSCVSDSHSSGPPEGWATSTLAQVTGSILLIAWGAYVYEHFHTIFGLFLVLLAPVAAFTNRGMARRSRQRLTDSATRSDERTGESLTPVINATSVHPTPTPVRWVGAADVLGGVGRINASTPLAVLELQGDVLTLRVRGGFLNKMFGIQRLTVDPESVSAIYPSRARLRTKAIAIRPWRQPPSYFLTIGNDRATILTALAAAGFPVEWDERRYSYN